MANYTFNQTSLDANEYKLSSEVNFAMSYALYKYEIGGYWEADTDTLTSGSLALKGDSVTFIVTDQHYRLDISFDNGTNVTKHELFFIATETHEVDVIAALNKAVCNCNDLGIDSQKKLQKINKFLLLIGAGISRGIAAHGSDLSETYYQPTFTVDQFVDRIDDFVDNCIVASCDSTNCNCI